MDTIDHVRMNHRPADPPARLATLLPLLEFRRLKTMGQRPSITVEGRTARSMRQLVWDLARQAGISATTLWNWYRRFQADGYPGLANRERSDKGWSRFFRVRPFLASVVARKAADGHSAHAIWKALRSDYGCAASYGAVLLFLRSLPGWHLLAGSRRSAGRLQ